MGSSQCDNVPLQVAEAIAQRFKANENVINYSWNLQEFRDAPVGTVGDIRKQAPRLKLSHLQRVVGPVVNSSLRDIFRATLAC